MKKYQKIEIIWQDAFTRDAWNNIDFLLKDLEKGNEQKTVGYFLGENKKWIIISSTIDKNDDRAASTWYIPKAWIIKKTML